MQEKVTCKCGNNALKGKDVCYDCFLKQFNSEQKKPRSHEEDDIQKSFFILARYEFP